MTDHPGSVGARDGSIGVRPASNDSAGVETIAPSHTHANPSTIAEEVAEDMTLAMFDGLLTAPLARIPDESEGHTGVQEEVAILKVQNEQLHAELASARSEIDFAGLKEEELENRHGQVEKTVQSLKQQVDSLVGQLQKSNEDLQDAQKQLADCDAEKRHLEKIVESYKEQLSTVQPNASHLPAQANSTSRDKQRESSKSAEELENECSSLRERVSMLETELAECNRDVSMQKDVASTRPTLELQADSSEETPLLGAAYQQISVLNTQLSHLYKELTMARTEVQNLKGQSGENKNASQEGSPSTHKQSQQIADLVSDIRHLQLDLEYHQQKLDQMIEEKQQMMKDHKTCQGELSDARQLLEERDQMLRHRDIDIARLKQELKNPQGSADGNGGEGTVLAALRAEAAAKDSALIVSHYELHKEKLMRDRMEQKNLKLMERMQKLMMVVETMRKENLSLERALSAKEKSHDEKDLQLRQVTQKAKQLNKIVKSSKVAPKGSSNPKGTPTVLDLESHPQQVLPPLDRSQRSVDSATGRRSGMSTPRTPRAPPSPYGSR